MSPPSFTLSLDRESITIRFEPHVPASRRATVAAMVETVMQVADGLDAARQDSAIARLAEIVLPDELAGARGLLAADDLELRDRFVRETSPRTSVEVAAQAGGGARNRYATAARWKKAGAVFSVNHRGAEYFPAFQFRDGRPASDDREGAGGASEKNVGLATRLLVCDR